MRWEARELSWPKQTARVARATVIAASCLLAACSIFSSSKHKPDPLPQPSGEARVEAVWKVALGGPSGVGFAPAIAGGSVWAATQTGTLAQIDLGTGQVRWRTAVGKPLSSGVGTDGSIAVVVSRDGNLLAFDAAGQPLWTSPLGGEVVSPPTVADGTVLLRTSDNRVLAFELATGKRRWTYQRQNPPLVLRNSGGIAMVPGIGFVGMPGGRVAALSLTSGAPRWDVPLAAPKGANEIERIADVVGSPLVIGRELCAVTYQGRIGCLDIATGSPVWSRDFSSAVGFDVDNAGLVAPDADDVVHAFDRRGTPVWQQKGYARRRLTAPLIIDSLIAIGEVQGHVLWMSRDTGRLAALSPTDGTAIVASPTMANQLVVVQTAGGAVHGFRIE